MANGSASPKGSCSCRKRSKTGDAARRYRSFWACLRAYLSLVRLAEGNECGGRCGASPQTRATLVGYQLTDAATPRRRDRGRSSLFAQARELSASPRRVCPTADTADPSNERSRRGRVFKRRVAQMGFLSCRAQSRHVLLLVIVKMRDSSTSLGMTEGVNRP